MIIIISNNLEILLQENLERAPISWSANHVLSYGSNFFFQVHDSLFKIMILALRKCYLDDGQKTRGI